MRYCLLLSCILFVENIKQKNLSINQINRAKSNRIESEQMQFVGNSEWPPITAAEFALFYL